MKAGHERTERTGFERNDPKRTMGRKFQSCGWVESFLYLRKKPAKVQALTLENSRLKEKPAKVQEIFT